MNSAKRKTKTKDKPDNTLSERFSHKEEPLQTTNLQTASAIASDSMTASEETENEEAAKDVSDQVKRLFDKWEDREVVPRDFQTEIPIDSMESNVGYSSLLRQMHRSFMRQVAFYRSEIGGSLTVDEARAAAFHACTEHEEAVQEFDRMMSLPLEILNFVDLMKLQSYSPRVAEGFWEMVKMEGRAEFESGYLAANINFPVGYMKELWNIARYLGVRESFIDDWKPKGGIEIALIDMLAQSWFQWQYWLEQTVKRSETRERETHPEYARWMAQREEKFRANGWTDGYWDRPYVSEQQALDHAVQMTDKFNRIFMRTLRQLRDFRRYSPVTINNPNQVNIATDGGQQINVANEQ